MAEALLLCLLAPASVLLGDWLPQRIFAEDARAVAAHLGRPLPPMPPLGTFVPGLRGRDNLARIPFFIVAALIGFLLGETGTQGMLAGVWVLALMTLLRIDLQYRLLPDLITQPMLWCGLLLQIPASTRTVGLEVAIYGAIMGYLPFRLINDVYFLLRGRQGMGQGDMKLLAALGAVWGPAFVIATYLLATLLALLGRLVLALSKKARLMEPFAFGPAIAVAALLLAIVEAPGLR